MILITVNDWFGKSFRSDKDVPVVQEKVSYISRMKLNDALERLKKHQEARDKVYTASTHCYTLLSVCEVGDIDDELIQHFRIRTIDDLPITEQEVRENY